MEQDGAQLPEERRVRLPAALLILCMWGAIGAAVWHASPKSDGGEPPAEPVGDVSILTFKARSAMHLARVLDAAWDTAEESGRVPGIAPVALPADMERLDRETRKRTFLRALAPHLLEVNREIIADRTEIKRIQAQIQGGHSPSDIQLAFLINVCRRYRIPDAAERLASGDRSTAVKMLLKRVDIVPIRLALAQAAVESAWGSSRLAREDNGIFGQCVAEGGNGSSGRAAPNGLWYARFRTLREAVVAYARNLNTYSAYAKFRQMRSEMRKKGTPLDAARLAEGLLPYSELGKWYVARVRTVIRSPDIAAYKQARLAPALNGVVAREVLTPAGGLAEGPDA